MISFREIRCRWCALRGHLWEESAYGGESCPRCLRRRFRLDEARTFIDQIDHWRFPVWDRVVEVPFFWKKVR